MDTQSAVPALDKHAALLRVMPVVMVLNLQRPGWGFGVDETRLDLDENHPLAWIYDNVDEGLRALDPNSEFWDVLEECFLTPEEASRPENETVLLEVWREQVRRSRNGRPSFYAEPAGAKRRFTACR